MKMDKTPAILFTPQAFDLLRKHMNESGKLTIPVRISLDCLRAMWVADDKGHVGRGDVTLPKGCDLDTITDMLAWVAQVRSESSRICGWRMPPLNTAYLCDDGRVRTIGEMLEGISVEFMPRDDVDLDLLMTCFGCDSTHL
ncbi:MAG: hypothetical protein IKF14_09015 [Atopobiaceae bacterium]|nr:hypothetical protein [Atopobiaceae bacterium]